MGMLQALQIILIAWLDPCLPEVHFCAGPQTPYVAGIIQRGQDEDPTARPTESPSRPERPDRGNKCD